ncbi:MAG: DUF413 domain-containing protein [Pseudomonadales bacterium]|nr:DUF413 domain-containing protein [Pseudomonadales bacterium]MCP5216229.1 DUF413 domain-containing protein [Pseudomonadales bacterium]
MELMTIESSGVFYDNDRFPIGFRRCGEFTIAEAELLHNYGNSLIALESGERSPMTKDEKHFVAVCKGEKEVTTELERVWKKYRTIAARSRLVSAFGASKIDRSPDLSEYAEDMDDI